MVKKHSIGKGKANMLPARIGKYYDADVPDTLDLAERGRLGLNHFTSIISEEKDYEMYWEGRLGLPLSELPQPSMVFELHPLLGCQAKCMEAMAMARIMSGSQQNIEREAKMVEMLASHIGEEGLYLVPKYPDKPWLGPPKDAHKPWLGAKKYQPYGHPAGQAVMLYAMLAWYQYKYKEDHVWKKLIDRMVDGIDRLLVVHKDDYAYIPGRGWMEEEYFWACYVKGRGWKDTKEPKDEKSGDEGSLFNQYAQLAGPLANWYMLTGNKQALRLSGELVRFLTKDKFWADWKGGEYPNVIGAEHAHWHGHFYGHINVLRSILEYAIATNDVQLKNFVRDGYEWARQPWLIGRGGFGGNGQGCTLPRLIGLAIKLTDAGVGDYWEDVDLYIRNDGTEMQFTPEDIPYLKSFGKREPTLKVGGEDPFIRAVGATEGVIEASMGAFSFEQFKFSWILCCSPWGNKGIFYAWHGTLRYADGVATVNLLLNRVSPWMDIDSFIPYEGKVVLRNKAVKEAFVRIPLWVDKKTVGCNLGRKKVQPEWFGRYLHIDGLKAGDIVTIEFPIEERIERWTTDDTLCVPIPPYSTGWPGKRTRNLTFKGNTLIKITPPMPNWPPYLKEECHMYKGRAEKYRTNKSPMIKVKRFVTPLDLKW